MDVIKITSLIWFFILAYVISWIIWTPLVASTQGWIDVDIPHFLEALGYSGPMLSGAVLFTWHYNSTSGSILVVA